MVLISAFSMNKLQYLCDFSKIYAKYLHKDFSTFVSPFTCAVHQQVPLGTCKILNLRDPVFGQQIRWHKRPVRKPFWLPPAKTKLYRIAKPCNIPHEEFSEISRLFCNYHTYMRAITNYFKTECQEMSVTGHITIAKVKLEEEELEKLLEENKIENKRVALLREERVAGELKAEEHRLLNLKEEHKKWLKEKKQEIETLVKREKELSKGYITMNNLEEEIEKSLDKVVNYNFAIDIDGKIYWETTPHPEISPYRQKN